MSRTCTKCGEAKPLEMFSRKLAGYQSKCKMCCATENKAWRLANQDEVKEKKNLRYLSNRDEVLQKVKAYYAANRVGRLAYLRKWREQNQSRIRDEYLRNAESYRRRVKEWRANNPDARRAQEVARRSRKRRIPSWADRQAMAAIYRQARELRSRGVDVHVDHIIPLCGRTVSGLHTHDNLRLVMAKENLKKGAKLFEELL